MKMKIVKCLVYLFGGIIALSFYSCAAGTIEHDVAFTVTNYLTKARHFLLFTILILDSGKEYWINLYSRLYYFYFTLARVKSFLQQNKILENSHKEIWSLSTIEPRKRFGEEFKKIRAECDYEIIENESEFIKNTNNIIITKHKEAFFKQVLDIQEYCQRKVDSKNNQNINEILLEIIDKYEIFLNKLKEVHEKE